MGREEGRKKREEWEQGREERRQWRRGQLRGGKFVFLFIYILLSSIDCLRCLLHLSLSSLSICRSPSHLSPSFPPLPYLISSHPIAVSFHSNPFLDLNHCLLPWTSWNHFLLSFYLFSFLFLLQRIICFNLFSLPLDISSSHPQVCFLLRLLFPVRRKRIALFRQSPDSASYCLLLLPLPLFLEKKTLHDNYFFLLFSCNCLFISVPGFFILSILLNPPSFPLTFVFPRTRLIDWLLSYVCRIEERPDYERKENLRKRRSCLLYLDDCISSSTPPSPAMSCLYQVLTQQSTTICSLFLMMCSEHEKWESWGKTRN